MLNASSMMKEPRLHSLVGGQKIPPLVYTFEINTKRATVRWFAFFLSSTKYSSKSSFKTKIHFFPNRS